MDNLQNVLARAVEQRQLPYVVASVADRNGVIFEGAAGEAAPGRKADQDTLFRIFSMTKAVGSAAAAILIDRGKLAPETPVADILPEWNQLKVLEGIKDGKPVMRAPKTRATARHLATHTSGLEYEFWCQGVVDYMEATGHPSVLSGTRDALNYPLMTDPGTRWGYGPSIDWLGMMVEKVDGRRIDQFCREEIFEPLGMKDTCFEPEGKQARLATPYIRGENGAFDAIDISPPAHPEVYGMGHALYSTTPDYMRFCRMVLNGGSLDGQRILGEKAMTLLSTDQMGGLSFAKMLSSSPLTADVDMFPGQPVGHTFGYLQNRTDISGRRRSGSLSWAGVMNTHYWIDPRTGLAAVFMTQSLPFVEQPLMDFYVDFEKAVYAARG
ncbi:serine hydrolase domain-containing protein [Rhizobium sp. C4]|uniref:serine hydrolase domain-containing protein n=1 Tax=Rhizobium sp. C4 TaxID=1349800 RepID=UPI001E63423F|nr:serine hydrolase domain-containing protein [Rhizobium sp. C4]MCD2172074.1 beta-lactamase family protein [Rhizobium sp. C4]